jgi:type I restriction enzyme R subunit
MTTDTTEKGLEALIVAAMTGRSAPASQDGFSDDWLLGDPGDYDRAWTVDLAQLRAFIAATQPLLVATLDLDADTPTRQKFLARLQGEISKRGIVDVLRRGVKHGPHDIGLFYGTPSPGNMKAAMLFGSGTELGVGFAIGYIKGLEELGAG